MRKISKLPKLLLTAVMGMTLMCGCELKPKFPEIPESETQTSYIMEDIAFFEPPPIEAKHYSFDEIENISDEELIGLADYARWYYPQNLFIEDYLDPLDGEFFQEKFIPAGADLDEYCREERHYRMYSENDRSEFINCSLEQVEDNDVFSAWLGTYIEVYSKRGNEREDYVLFLKNFSEDGQRYTGEMTADEIMRNFDVLTYDHSIERKICRRVVETEDTFIYEYYAVSYIYGDWDINCEIELNRRVLDISKEDGSFPCVEPDFYFYPYSRRHGERLTYSRSCEIPDSAPTMFS